MSFDTYTSDYIAIHVSLNGRHLFRTEQQVMGFDIPKGLVETLAAKFPASEGYKISVETKPNSGRSVEVAN